MFPIRPPKSVAVALLAVTAMLSGACSSSGTGDTAPAGVATLADDVDEASAGAGTPTEASVEADPATEIEAPEDIDDAFALFEECMTDAGFDFGGVATTSGAGGRLEVESLDDAAADSGRDPQGGVVVFDDLDPEAFQEANEVYEPHLANAVGGFDLTPEQQVAFEDAQREFSECMGEQGIELPEFDGAGGGAVIVEVPAGDFDPQEGPQSLDDFGGEEFEAAAEACQHVFDEVDGLDVRGDALGESDQ